MPAISFEPKAFSLLVYSDRASRKRIEVEMRS